jgi:uncharacterized membrane protein
MAAHRSEQAVLHRDKAEVEFSRIVAFSDGVFSIAITLLVLALEIPATGDVWDALEDRGAEFFAYFLSFAVVGRFWIAHHRIFGAVARFNSTLLVINLAYLAFIALIPFTSEVLGTHGDDSWGVAMYAANLTAVSLISWSMIRYAYSRSLMREDAEEYRARFAGGASLLVALVFALSIPIAFLNPTVATISWASLFVLGDRVVDKLSGIDRPR